MQFFTDFSVHSEEEIEFCHININVFRKIYSGFQNIFFTSQYLFLVILPLHLIH